MTYHDLVQKAIKEPSTLTKTEICILLDGADRPSRADIDKEIAVFDAMPEEEGKLLDKACKTSADPQETKALVNAGEASSKLMEERAAARRERQASGSSRISW